jgi:hypothetical protein
MAAPLQTRPESAPAPSGPTPALEAVGVAPRLGPPEPSGRSSAHRRIGNFDRRTQEEYADVAARCDLRLQRVVGTMSPYSILEMVAG